MDEPAFPRSHAHDGHNGMSLRDYFAAKAMQGFCSGGTKGDPLDSIADLAYRMADAMMAARTAGVTASQECPRCGGRKWIWDIAEGRQTSKVPCPSCGVMASEPTRYQKAVAAGFKPRKRGLAPGHLMREDDDGVAGTVNDQGENHG